MASSTASAITSAATLTSSGDSAWVPPSNGIVGGYTGVFQPATLDYKQAASTTVDELLGNDANILRAMTAFSAIAWYNAIELIILVFIRFKKKVGLYFWSMLITSISIIIYQFGAWGKMINLSNIRVFSLTFMNVGWIFMVTGQSIVLYSRLHLITQNRRILRAVLCMILVDAVVLYIPTSTLNYGAIHHPTHRPYVDGYQIMERIQMTLFTLQELIISIIYLVEVGKFLKITYEDQTRKLMYELIVVNIALIVLDVALLSVEYENLYQIETTLKGLVYSVKLKLELGVLSKLVKIVTARQQSYQVTAPDQEMDLKRFASADINRNILAPTQTTGSGSTPGSPGVRTSDDTQTSNLDGSNSKITDFAGGGRGDPLAGPSVEEGAAAQAYLHDAKAQHSETSSIAELYPGKLEPLEPPSPTHQWPLTT